MKDSKQRLFEVMGRLDKTFKPKNVLNEWNFDKKKDDDSEEEKKEGEETQEHEESETPAEEKKEHKEDKELDEADEVKPKIPVNAIAKVGK
jgi:hypothetical protein